MARMYFDANKLWIATTDMAVDNSATALFTTVIGNRNDTASALATASLMAQVKYLVANLSTDADIATLIGTMANATIKVIGFYISVRKRV